MHPLSISTFTEYCIPALLPSVTGLEECTSLSCIYSPEEIGQPPLPCCFLCCSFCSASADWDLRAGRTLPTTFARLEEPSLLQQRQLCFGWEGVSCYQLCVWCDDFFRWVGWKTSSHFQGPWHTPGIIFENFLPWAQWTMTNAWVTPSLWPHRW